MLELPTGTVTFLFTDIEGSTRLLQELGGDTYGRVQDEHAGIMRRAIATGGGVEVRTEGDSFFVAFPTPAGALHAAVAAQRALAFHRWPAAAAIGVRMGIHTGEGVLGGDDYLGIDVNRAARIAAAGHGGQVLVSDATWGLVEHAMPDGVSIRNLGAHRLKDIEHPERIHDLVIEGLIAEFPPLRSLDGHRTNLPAHRTSFVGRERESAEIADLLSGRRLLTLTGPGGTGKTRLASRAAADLIDRFRDGVFLVDLSTVTEPDLVLPGIAKVLKVRELPGRDLLGTVVEHLAQRELLLVLDNLEQLLEATPIVGKLLDGAPGIRVLATSRIPTRLSGEQEYHVRPLALPDPALVQDPASLSACEAVALFVARARAVDPSFRITEESAQAVAEITTRLDGLPLALELAASRVRVLTPAALVERLEQRLPLLTDRSLDVPERQRTLSGAIRWSYDLLDPAEQRLFARLSVFAGEWTLEAAEAVCGPDLDVFEGISWLVDNSLVYRVDLSEPELRFGMLRTIREFAAEGLAASGEEHSIRSRHAGFFRGLAEEAGPRLLGEGQTHWLGVLERERDNFRAALEWAEEGGDVTDAIETASAIWRFWQLRGHLSEGRSRLGRLLALPAAARRDAVRARGLGALGGLAYWQADYEPVRKIYADAVSIARDVGDRKLLSWALFDLSFVPLLLDGDAAATQDLLRESLATADENDLALHAQIWTGFGYLEIFRGDPSAAVEPTERAIAIFRQLGDRLSLSESLLGRAGIEFIGGNVEAARGHVHEATRIVSGSESPLLLATVVIPNAYLANHDGRHERAACLVGAWDRIQEDLEARFPSAAMDHFGDPTVEARAALGDEAFGRARDEGFAMTVDQVVDLVTEELSGPP